MTRVPDAVQRAAERSGAPLIRDRYKFGVWNDPGSAAHHEDVLRCARETRKMRGHVPFPCNATATAS